MKAPSTETGDEAANALGPMDFRTAQVLAFLAVVLALVGISRSRWSGPLLVAGSAAGLLAALSIRLAVDHAAARVPAGLRDSLRLTWPPTFRIGAAAFALVLALGVLRAGRDWRSAPARPAESATVE